MLRFLRRAVLTTAALVAAVVAYTLVTLPPRTRVLQPVLPAGTIYGAYHIHTTRSDGTATPDQVAAAAARAGLAFVILTDHGNGTRAPDSPAYLHGVLVMDAVEISTNAGHLVALGLTSAAPYPLAGDARDVLDDVHRLGGWGVIAHADSPKPELRWRPGQAQRPAVDADGIEWLNADSVWREHTREQLTGALARSAFRAPESLATLYTRPARTLQRWDIMTRPRSVVGLAGVDAHGMQGWGGAYEQLFRTLSQAVVLDAPLSGDAATDAARILEALRRGHAFSVITAWAGPASITLTASDGASMVAMGDRLATQQNSVEIRAAATGSTAARLVLSHLGGEVASGIDELTFHTPPNDAGAYRVEAYLPGHPAAPWIVSNPVYVGPEVAPAAPARPAPITSTFALTGADPAAWSIEHGPSSSGDVINIKPDLGFAYHVGAAEPAREYVALAYRMRDTSLAFDRLQFVGQADRPTRIWVQLRFPGTGDQRWIRSIYLDATPRPVVIALEDLVPADPQGSLRPVVARIQAVLFVVDRTNSALGSSGRVTLREITLTASAGSGPDR